MVVDRGDNEVMVALIYLGCAMIRLSTARDLMIVCDGWGIASTEEERVIVA